MTQEIIVHPNRAGDARRTTFGYLTDDHPKLDRIQNGISALCGIIAVVATFAIAFVTLFDTFTRTLFDYPLGWSLSLIEHVLVPAVAFFGITTAYRGGAHVAVVSVFQGMSTKLKKCALLLAYAVVLLGLMAMAGAGAVAALHALQSGDGPVPGSSELLIPNWIWKAIVPVSMSLCAVVVAVDLWRELAAPWSRVATDYEPGDTAHGPTKHTEECAEGTGEQS